MKKALSFESIAVSAVSSAPSTAAERRGLYQTPSARPFPRFLNAQFARAIRADAAGRAGEPRLGHLFLCANKYLLKIGRLGDPDALMVFLHDCGQPPSLFQRLAIRKKS